MVSIMRPMYKNRPSSLWNFRRATGKRKALANVNVDALSLSIAIKEETLRLEYGLFSFWIGIACSWMSPLNRIYYSLVTWDLLYNGDNIQNKGLFSWPDLYVFSYTCGFLTRAKSLLSYTNQNCKVFLKYKILSFSRHLNCYLIHTYLAVENTSAFLFSIDLD